MNFNFPYVAFTIIGLYLVSLWLVNAKKLSLITQRRFWNVTMGTFFLLTALSGLIMVIQLSYGFYWKLPFNVLFWHVEAGIGFASIALFHILWHSAYFMLMLKRK